MAALPDGRMYVSNDRSAKGGWNEIILGLRRSNIVFFDGARWSVAAGRPGGRSALATVKGPDNLGLGGPDGLLMASHADSLAFLRHTRSPRNLSPSHIYALDSGTGSLRLLFADDGSRISASAAVRFGAALYLGQVFEPFVLKCAP